jgi:hypothetical protein
MQREAPPAPTPASAGTPSTSRATPSAPPSFPPVPPASPALPAEALASAGWPTPELTSSAPPARRRRRGGKRVKFQRLPHPPQPVRALWTAASEEEKQRTHLACTVMLSYWLGKIDKAEAAAQLAVSELRVWQLSQQALAGMAAGLLKQPRTRRLLALPKDPEEDPVLLRKKIAHLQRELAAAARLIELLKDLPGQRSPTAAPAASAAVQKQRAPGKAARARQGRARSALPGSRPEESREPAPASQASTG